MRKRGEERGREKEERRGKGKRVDGLRKRGRGRGREAKERNQDLHHFFIHMPIKSSFLRRWTRTKGSRRIMKEKRQESLANETNYGGDHQ